MIAADGRSYCIREGGEHEGEGIYANAEDEQERMYVCTALMDENGVSIVFNVIILI